mmetsp:Transcript_23175/g.67198  ORF Transcript_23175/g.67198 Transcript_23175/m.67198 type:complete len:103 (-) Transcript_23175:84-392(-)
MAVARAIRMALLTLEFCATDCAGVGVAMRGAARGVGPLTSGERAAVGEALSHALGVMSGKEKSGSKVSICMSLFPDGPPADAEHDVSWQSCKEVLPGMAQRQ